jgi:hypothetical protein
MAESWTSYFVYEMHSPGCILCAEELLAREGACKNTGGTSLFFFRNQKSPPSDSRSGRLYFALPILAGNNGGNTEKTFFSPLKLDSSIHGSYARYGTNLRRNHLIIFPSESTMQLTQILENLCALFSRTSLLASCVKSTSSIA